MWPCDTLLTLPALRNPLFTRSSSLPSPWFTLQQLFQGQGSPNLYFRKVGRFRQTDTLKSSNEMAISQAIVPAQALAEDCCYSCDRYHPSQMSSVPSKKGEVQRNEQRASARGKTDARPVKANRILSRGGVGNIEAMSSRTSGAHFKDARMSNDKGIVEHRRGSSQSLTLDLVGLDLGRRARLESMGEEAGSKKQPSYGKQPSPVRLRDTEKQIIDTSQQKAGEDSFFAHLRSCEDSHDILTSDDVLPVPDPSSSAAESTKGEAGPQSICGDSSEQVLGGFASLGYDSNAQSRNNLELDTGANSEPTSTPASPRFGIAPSQAVSPWRTLVPIVHDAMETLDTLSIEEMGLHSINVGSSDDWEGVTLSYPCETCHQSEVPEMGNAVDAQWTVARSMKRQRKWIVTPKLPTSSRTVVISDHVVSRQEQQKQQQTLFGQATFELRFLQANNEATSSTILLASPAIHRLMAAEGKSALEGADSTSALSSLGVHEEQSRPAPMTASVQVGSTPVSCGGKSEDRRPMMQPKAATVAHTDELKPVLGHSKSSSTIHASAAMVILESRRPSLGKSVSHDSLAFHTTPPLSNSPRPSTYSATTALDNTPLSMRSLQKMDSMLSLPQPPLDRLPTESFAPFGDYTIGLDPLDSPGPAATEPMLTSSGLGPSPRTSIQDVRSHQSMRDQTPVLSLVDPSRMADCHRHQMEAAGIAPPVRWNTSWQPMSPNSMAKSTLRKDQRLSDWFRKKVFPTTGSSHMNILSPPLPPAWEPKREQRMQGLAIAATTRMTPAGGAKSVAKGAKSVKALSTSTTSATTLATTTSSDGDTGQQTTSEIGDANSLVESPSTTSQSSLSSLTKEESREGEQSKVRLGDAGTVPLAQMHTFHGHNVWPGVSSARNERRRSNSDDNLAALGEAEKRRLEVLGREWATRKPQMATARGNLMAQNNDDSLVRFSSSMPPHSVLCLYGEYARRRPRLATPVDLIGLVDAPAQSITMVIPLLMATNNGVTARYLRVSFVPFGLDSAAPSLDGDDAGHLSMDQAMLPPAPLHSSQAVSHATWYKKLTHVWGANTRSGSPSSSEEEPESRADRHVACLAPVRAKRRNSTVESFRIIAKILEHPDGEEHRSMSTTGLDGSLPAPFPFPVILGVCDRQRSLKLIPEGWQAIGLLNGPADAGTNSPMSGVADLIIAGCAACMDL